jgi:WhiB family redox-sensing transcriptional regulator
MTFLPSNSEATSLWMSTAACRGKPAHWWFPELADSYRVTIPAKTYVNARSVCRKCPVQERCLRHAIETPELSGMWGGKTERERLKIRRGGLTVKAAPKLTSSKRCVNCGQVFDTTRNVAKFCSAECAYKLNRNRVNLRKKASRYE